MSLIPFFQVLVKKEGDCKKKKRKRKNGKEIILLNNQFFLNFFFTDNLLKNIIKTSTVKVEKKSTSVW